MKIKHVFSMLGACAALALAAAACDDHHHRSDVEYDMENYCAQFATCDTCTPQNGCGWCFDGTNSFCGSDANQCSSEWTWETNFCHDVADASVSSSTNDAASSTATEDATSDADSAASSDADVDGE